MNDFKYDTEHIHTPQQETLRVLLETMDLSSCYFVGGIADYLNLRSYYDMPVNDIDMVITSEAMLEVLQPHMEITKYKSRFYEYEEMDVYVGNYWAGERRVHIDFFKRSFFYGSTSTSQLLGVPVKHASFETMKRFHNTHVSKLTSKTLGPKYEWKRLYKHSRKAGLYNLITYKEQKKEAAHVIT